MNFETKAIHAGIEPDISSGAIMTPIFQTSTYVQEAPGKHKGFEYARTHNPTRHVLQSQLAALESGSYGICFASGLAATDAVAKLYNPGDHIISSNDLYGGSYRIFTKVFQKYGLQFSFVDMTDASNIEKEIRINTKLIWIETPTNPMLNIVDIPAVVALAKKHNILVCVDNTFASPYLQRPLELGADMVLHSATKYLGGHSDVIHGAVVVNDKALAEQLYFLQNACGAVPGPQDCFLILRGIKTLHVRMDRACENATKIAGFLRSHSKVEKVNYPGFEEHPGYTVAKRQMKHFGAMVSFSLKDDSIEAANKVLSSTQLFSLAESLGGVESLIGHPATMTHGSIPLEERKKTGVVDSLIRLSVGIENAEDLIEDLKNALA
jgi:cystathionine beta-lyase